MIKHGIKVLAIDRQLNEDFILGRLSDKKLILFSKCDFENLVLSKT